MTLFSSPKAGLAFAGLAFAGLTLLGCLAAPAAAQKPNLPIGLQITDATDASTLVNEILGSGVTAVGTPTLIGQSDTGGAQQGIFNTIGSSIVGFNSGIVLTSGYASNVVGPNTKTGVNKSWGTAGDADLTALAGAQTNDANVLSFQFKTNPGIKNLGFHYVFGSDEYPEFVNKFNDAFGFYVDGHNVALLPGTGDPVTINSINDNVNSAFFRPNYTNNGNGTYGALNTELDGLTTSLFADVQSALDPSAPGGVHTLTLKIADTGDTLLDSAVFIQGSSFTQGGTPTVPEPGTLALLGLGVPVLIGAARRKRSR